MKAKLLKLLSQQNLLKKVINEGNDLADRFKKLAGLL